MSAGDPLRDDNSVLRLSITPILHTPPLFQTSDQVQDEASQLAFGSHLHLLRPRRRNSAPPHRIDDGRNNLEDLRQWVNEETGDQRILGTKPPTPGPMG